MCAQGSGGVLDIATPSLHTNTHAQLMSKRERQGKEKEEKQEMEAHRKPPAAGEGVMRRVPGVSGRGQSS